MTDIKENEHWTMGPDYVEVIYTEPNEKEKKMLEGTLTPKELIEKEKQDALQSPEGHIIENDRRKEYITQVKCYALTKIGKKPLDNPSTFNQEVKIKLMETMDEIMKTMTEEQIKTEFETVINLHVFSDVSMDYSSLHK
jgi:hypothetical protein